MKSKVLAITCLLISIFSCVVSKDLAPTQDDADRFQQSGKGSATLLDLQNGYELYLSKCSGCHNLYLPKQFSEEKWEQEFPEMFNKAKVAPNEGTLIRNYIFSKLAIAGK